jgi:hypothetical protein
VDHIRLAAYRQFHRSVRQNTLAAFLGLELKIAGVYRFQRRFRHGNAPQIVKSYMNLFHINPVSGELVSKPGWFFTSSCGFSAYGLQNHSFSRLPFQN